MGAAAGAGPKDLAYAGAGAIVGAHAADSFGDSKP